MNTKNILVSFLAIASVLLLVATVSAAEITTDYLVEVDDTAVGTDDVSVIAGDKITLDVYFTALENDTDVTVEAEINGEKEDTDAMTSAFDIESGKRYRKSLTIEVPYELKDEISDDVILAIEIDGKDHRTMLSDITLRVQRPSYNADVKSITSPQKTEAGDTFPVDIVLKNRGYNDLDDIYVTAKIPALGVERNAYFGDLVAIENDCNECDDDDEDTIFGRLYLTVPYDVEEGVYALEIEVTNDDTTTNVVKQIVIENDFPSNMIVVSTSKTAAVGQNAEYELLIVNPTNKLKVYRIVPESSSSLTSNVNEPIVAVTAGSSKKVTVTANADSEGEYTFDVNVFSGEDLVSKVSLELDAEGSAVSNPIVVLTVILAIVFLVLLIVLIVLVTKKPEKTEEFGESYY